MRYSVLCAAALLTSGCALPVPLQLASWAISGISYATTGKSISDHAVSAVTEKDCAVHRIALGKQICTNIAPDETMYVHNDPTEPAPDQPAVAAAQPTERLRESMIALAENLEDDLQPASGETDTPPLNSALLAMAETLNEIERNAPPTTSIGGKGGKHYLVIGRYRALGEAEKVRTRHASLGTKVRMILHDGALFYQVTAGAFSRPAAEELEAKLDDANRTARVALLCSDGVTPAPCQSEAAQITALAKSDAQFTK